MNFSAHTITALLGKAVSDAFGCPFEFHESAPKMSTLSMKVQRYLSCWDDVHQPIRRCRTSGLYSDDTQQALVLLWIWSQLLTKGKDPLKSQIVAELFVKVCRRMSAEPVPGTGSFGVHRGTGQSFREVILRGKVPDTAGLGGAMRIGPVATLIEDPMLVLPWAVAVTSSTTSSPVGLAGAAMVAAYAWNAARSQDGWGPVDARALGYGDISQEVQEAWDLLCDALVVLQSQDEEALLNFASKSGTAGRTLRCAADGFALTGIPWVIHCVNEAASFEDALLRVCASGGDTDTVAAIAGCLSALRFGRESIPAWMVDGLVGREYVLNPNCWHPITSEKPFVDLDRHLQNQIEKQIREAAVTRMRKRRK